MPCFPRASEPATSRTRGSGGVISIDRAGGTVIAQDQATSEFFRMPGEAIETGGVTFVVPLAAIAPAIAKPPR